MKRLIKHYRVEIADGSGIIGAANKFESAELEVIGENSLNLVVNDLHFTTIRKTSDKYSTCLNRPRIGISVRDNVWGNRITYSLYTEKRKRAATIRKEIERAVTDKLGFFLHGLDLSVVKD